VTLYAIFSHSEVIDKILVVVNDEVITQREVDRKVAPLYEQYKTMYENSELMEKLKVVYKSVLEQLINDKLVISEARRRGVEITAKEIDDELNKVTKRFASDEEFYLTLDKQGISVEELKENYKSSFMAKKLIDVEIGAKVTITPIEIIGYYDNHKQEFMSPEMIKVRSILIKIKKDRGSEASLNLAKEILGRLQKGEDFAEIAKVYSDGLYASSGGEIGYIKRGEMIKRIDSVIFGLKEGETSEMLRTDLGFHFFKVEDKKEARLMDFDEVKDGIEKFIFNSKIQKRLKEYIQQLRENAYITYK
ncbi:MAG: peptidylprolyl isomerase, partial [Candidatus Omnitrophica bacterium]|nr:peptidylprolyl isomerase [Candidatus Omnitrophota bacterium]